MTFSKEYTPSEFFDLLNEYGKAVKNGNYKKTIPYDTWKKLRKVNETVTVVVYPTVNIAVSVYEGSTGLYCEGVEHEGFASFFCCEKCKCEEKDDMAMDDVFKVAIDGTVSVIDDTILATKIEPEINGSVMISNDDWLGELGEKKTQKLEDLIDNLDTRINELVKQLTEKADVDSLDELVKHLANKADLSTVTELFNYTVRDQAAIDRLEAKTFENRNEINHLDDRLDELNGCITVLTSNFSKVNDALCSLREELTDFEIELEKKEDKIKCEIEVNESKENKRMKNFNFDFGPCTNDNVRMSMYGLAVKNAAGTYVSLNPSTKEVVDVDIFNFDGGKYLFKMPVAIKDIAVGDVIIHNKKPMFVEGVSARGDILAIDPVAGERKEVMLTRSPFNFNYATKVVNLFGAGGMATPNADNPFGNMLPFMLMNEEDGDIDPMMLMFMTNQNGGANTSAFGNPMMMYFLMKDKGEIDPMLMFMMMNQQQPPHTCQCENKCAQA